MSKFKMKIFEDITFLIPKEILEFESLEEARRYEKDYIKEFDEPCHISDSKGKVIYRNFPNVYALATAEERQQVSKRYYARQKNWREVYNPMIGAL